MQPFVSGVNSTYPMTSAAINGSFMIIVKQSPWLRVIQTHQYVLVSLLESDFRVLSSSVLNGGLTHARHVLNLKVPAGPGELEAPAITLQNYADSLECTGEVVGMMTAASMDSFRLYEETVQGVEVVVLVTCGLNNARCVGDHAEYRSMLTEPGLAGTINIIMLTSVAMSDAAKVEAVQMITEAKSAALFEAGIVSPVSQRMATGTGTDAVAVVSRVSGQTVAYCGKHVLFGEVLGRLVFDAVTDSIAWYRQGST